MIWIEISLNVNGWFDTDHHGYLGTTKSGCLYGHSDFFKDEDRYEILEVDGGTKWMITEHQLNKFRLDGTLVRVIRDALEDNDVIGQIVAWDDAHVVLRKRNRRVVKLSRDYHYQPVAEPRALE